MMRMLRSRLAWAMTIFAYVAGVAQAGVISFVNDFEGWLEAAGDVVQEIDFETLLNGNPSHVGFPITEHSNYTDQGVTFSAVPTDIDVVLFFGGNDISGYSLGTEGDSLEIGIVSPFVEPAFAAGAFFPAIITFQYSLKMEFCWVRKWDRSSLIPRDLSVSSPTSRSPLR